MSKRVEFDREKAIDLYNSGLSPKQIGDELGIKYQTILGYLKRVGVFKSTKKPRSKSTKLDKVYTMEEKIEYCNKKYGKGRWKFLTKEEALEAFLFEQFLRGN